MNNHKKAKAYILKSSLIGNGVDVEYGGLDSVKLKGIKYDSDGEFIVPEFITDIEEGCFYGKNYSKIVINNSKYRKFDASRLCVGMESNILDVKFKNPQMVKSMEDMFNGCNNLEYLQLCGLDTSNVVNMRGLFNGCKKLKSIDLSQFNTSKVRYMGNMFAGCE